MLLPRLPAAHTDGFISPSEQLDPNEGQHSEPVWSQSLWRLANSKATTRHSYDGDRRSRRDASEGGTGSNLGRPRLGMTYFGDALVGLGRYALLG